MSGQLLGRRSLATRDCRWDAATSVLGAVSSAKGSAECEGVSPLSIRCTY